MEMNQFNIWLGTRSGRSIILLLCVMVGLLLGLGLGYVMFDPIKQLEYDDCVSKFNDCKYLYDNCRLKLGEIDWDSWPMNITRGEYR